MPAEGVGRDSFEKRCSERQHRKQSQMTVVIDSTSSPSPTRDVHPSSRTKQHDTRGSGGVVMHSGEDKDAEKVWGGGGGSSRQSGGSVDEEGERERESAREREEPTPTQLEEKAGLDRLLDALTPQSRCSPQKPAARGSMGGGGSRRSVRSSLSIQLGFVAGRPQCSALQCTAMHCNILHTLQLTATHCNSLQHTTCCACT